MTRLRRGYGEAGGSRWIGFSRRRSQIIRQRRKNQAAKAAYAANALRTTRSTPRRPRKFIELFSKNYHRALATRFPFALCYSVSKQTAFVRAIVDCRRDSNVDQRTSAISSFRLYPEPKGCHLASAFAYEFSETALLAKQKVATSREAWRLILLGRHLRTAAVGVNGPAGRSVS